MQKKDLSPARQQRLVPVDGYSGALALIPPPTPRALNLSGVRSELTRAHAALALLKDLSSRLPNPDLMTRTADRREAVRSSQIEGTSSDPGTLFKCLNLTLPAVGRHWGRP